MTWKTKVSKANVLLFQLQASVHGIKEKGSGLSPITYPTPTAMDHIDRKGMRPSRAATNRKTGYLSEMIKMYPTPTSRDWKDTGINTNYEKLNKKRILSGQVMMEQKKVGGKLNPNFVEFLMGYHTNWTKIDPTE
jgi:hypothetical protein